jgi:signal transduction histidine kinase
LVNEKLIIALRQMVFHKFEPMKKKILNTIIGLIVISLLGIIAVQYFWIRNAIRIKEAQFNRSVNEALTDAVNKLETREDIAYMRKHLMGDSIRTLVQAFSSDSILSLNAKLDSLLSKDDFALIPPPPPPPPPSQNQRITRHSFTRDNQGFVFNYQWSGNFDEDSLQKLREPMTLVLPEELDQYVIDINQYILDYRDVGMDIRKVDSVLRRYEMENLRQARRNQPHPSWIQEQDVMHFIPPAVSKKNPVKDTRKDFSRKKVIRGNPPEHIKRNEAVTSNMRKITNKARKIKDVIHKMAIELESKPVPIKERIDKKHLQNVLRKSLSDKNINLPFEFSIFSPAGKNDTMPVKSDGFRNEYLSTQHKVALFPNDIFQKPDRLLVYFPGQKSVLLRSLSLLMLGSILFTLVIAITSILSIFIMLRQKKISDIKTDFINNMTHEFKTPLATISIAVDSINNPKVIAEPETIRSYTKVIKEENNRMNARVEQILQMSLLDSTEFTLDLRPVDLNTLVEKVASHFRLQLQSREGHLEVILAADKSVINADETHLSNVLINLLDNANKYSPGKPDIRVGTKTSGADILLTVEDKGIGMNPETQHKIFEKFYRVTSGNIHNVKGFGLGLSYSKAIVLSHKGEIQVYSEPGKGSRFEISLPLAENVETVKEKETTGG